MGGKKYQNSKSTIEAENIKSSFWNMTKKRIRLDFLCSVYLSDICHTYLYEQCSMLRSTITQVMPVDSKHTVVDTQAAIPCRQTSF